MKSLLKMVLFLILLLIAHTSYADINSDLIQAAGINDAAKVKQLLKQGADVNAKDKYGNTALMIAAISGHTDTAKVLIDGGADVNAKDWSDDTALVLAIEGEHKDIVRLLKQTMARRHMVRGQAAAKIAKTPADYEDAIREFEQAAKFAPDWPEIYYNLGVVQEKAKEYDKAIENLEKYLALAPNATDADVVREFIYKIEFLKERGWSMEDLVGTWVGPKEVGNLTISLKKSGERYPKRFFYQKGEFVVMPSWPSYRVHIHSAKFDGKQLIINLSHFHENGMTGRDEHYDLTMVSKGRMTGTVKINEQKGPKTMLIFTVTGEWLRK